jgi:putative pyruvate formate lyase activating enzyme
MPRVHPEFALDPFTPVYLAPANRAALADKVDAAIDLLRDCHACPRACSVNRLDDQTGVCRIGRHARVASAFAHHGEEQCLRGTRGSGTIFFARCNLRCVFCQNADISQMDGGDEMRARQIADVMLHLQGVGCHNINFVTPEHVVPQVVEALAEAIDRGLHLPVVYNTSAYDDVDSLRLLDGLIDIYMPDFKVWTRASGKRYLAAADYPDRARAAIKEMHRQVGDLRFSPEGLARRGLLVRHLVMPGLADETGAIFEWLANDISPDTFVNVMDQYRPANRVGRRTRAGAPRFAEIDRAPSRAEIAAAYGAAKNAGLHRFDKPH